MDYKKLIMKLMSILPKKIRYGELVGAPYPYNTMGDLVYEDPEPYVIEEAISAIETLEIENQALRNSANIYKELYNKAIDMLRQHGWCTGCVHFRGLAKCGLVEMKTCVKDNDLYKFKYEEDVDSVMEGDQGAQGTPGNIPNEVLERLELTEGIPIDRLRETVEAEKTGRCVTFPRDDMMYHIEGSAEEKWVANKPIQDVVLYVGFGLAHLKYSLTGLGNTIFFSREEAERKLREETDK